MAARGLSGRQFWRSLEELADDPAVVAALHREFPEQASELSEGPSRRQFLQLMGASLALAGVQGCMPQPQEKVVSYVRAPEQIIPGQPLYYATAMTHDGAAAGLLVETQMGRPVKVEGNPLQPAVPEAMQAANARASGNRLRFGATDAYSQAVVLSLYDPDRAQTITYQGQLDTWDSFTTQLRAQLEQLQPSNGKGLRILTDTIVSPTAANQLQQLLASFPDAHWHQYEPVNCDQQLLGSQMAFGRGVQPFYHLEQADVIVSLDADFLVDGPRRLWNARQFASRRRVTSDDGAASPAMNRLYVVETSTSVTGAAADHRLPLGPQELVAFAAALAGRLGLEGAAGAAGAPDSVPDEWFGAVVDDLQKSPGRSLVVAGRGQPPAVHAIAHWLNNKLGNVGKTVEYYPRSEARPEGQGDSIRELAAAMHGGEVAALVILGGNPVFDAPADLEFAPALAKVPFTAHWSLYDNETTAGCVWHVSAAHLFESWSDTRAADGTASLVQPLIAPLYDGKTIHEMLAALQGNARGESYEIVRDYWRGHHDSAGHAVDFDTFWRTALHDGVVAGSAAMAQSVSLRPELASEVVAAIGDLRVTPADSALQVAFRPDPSVWDGRFANNGWLQELPRPFTKLTWDNAALVSPAVAEEHNWKTGDVIAITVGGTAVEVPVFAVPGHPRQTITLNLGYGRRRAGRVGNGVGADVYPVRTSGTMWFRTIDKVQATGRTHPLATTQHHHLMEGRHLVRAGTWDEYQAHPEHPAFMEVGHDSDPKVSMYPEHTYDGYKWGMVVNQSACIGCNACVVACQAENNIPVVGKEQVATGREMQWLRIDNYYQGPTENPNTYHQPVLCMHCELAPCEVVCPVAATTHSDEGLNEMTYNRCVGTRYCSNNCPYKVRRFNFLDYNAELRQDPTLQLLPNPDVTVRARGVMEKCTYCVQRINAARINSENEDRTIQDGEILTACQAACPAQALTFGNLNDEQSQVTQAADNSLNYSLLGELNTRPRTTYLAAVRNPHPALAKSLEDGSAH